MAGLIKNIPVLSFSIQGNRGHNFPILGHLTEGFDSPYRSNLDCSLQQEQDGIFILTDDPNGLGQELLVVCEDVIIEGKQPDFGCFLSTQEDPYEPLLQQEGNPIVVECE